MPCEPSLAAADDDHIPHWGRRKAIASARRARRVVTPSHAVAHRRLRPARIGLAAARRPFTPSARGSHPDGGSGAPILATPKTPISSCCCARSRKSSPTTMSASASGRQMCPGRPRTRPRVAPSTALAPGAIRRSFVSIRRVVQVRLDGRLGAAKSARDLGDRQALLGAMVSGQRSCTPSLLHTVSD